MLQGTILTLSLIFVATNLVVDLLQSMIDPRIRRSLTMARDSNAVRRSRRRACEEQAAPATQVRGYWQSVGYRLRHDPVTLVFGAIVLLIVLAAIFAPLVAPFDPYKESIIGRLKPFGWRGHLLGTDELGRDMLSRLIYGGRVSLLMGLRAGRRSPPCVGGTLGVIAGFAGGTCNTAIMRTMDVFYAFPSVLLAVAISGAMGGGMVNGMLALTLVFIPPMCRVAETATTQVRALDFIEAARASGAGTLTIIRYHVLGNVLGPVFIYASSPGQRQHPAGLGPVVSRPGREAADAGLGADAQHAAPVDLRRADRLRAAGRGDLHHLDLLQPGQRRLRVLPWTCGCEPAVPRIRRGSARARHPRPRRPRATAADRARPLEALPGPRRRQNRARCARWTASPSRCSRARPSASSANPAAASPRWPGCCCISSPRTPAN